MSAFVSCQVIAPFYELSDQPSYKMSFRKKIGTSNHEYYQPNNLH